MPRRPDPTLEDRILNAAHTLWKSGGEKALTLRAVAKAVKSNTPSVYQRFRSREDNVRGLLQRIHDDIRASFLRCQTVED